MSLPGGPFHMRRETVMQQLLTLGCSPHAERLGNDTDLPIDGKSLLARFAKLPTRLKYLIIVVCAVPIALPTRVLRRGVALGSRILALLRVPEHGLLRLRQLIKRRVTLLDRVRQLPGIFEDRLAERLGAPLGNLRPAQVAVGLIGEFAGLIALTFKASHGAIGHIAQCIKLHVAALPSRFPFVTLLPSLVALAHKPLRELLGGAGLSKPQIEQPLLNTIDRS